LLNWLFPQFFQRGEGFKRFLIQRVKSEPGIAFSSSGTTSNTPARVYRIYLELAVMTRANTLLFEYVDGGELERGRGIAYFPR